MSGMRGAGDRARSATAHAARTATSRAAVPFWVVAAAVVALVAVFVSFGGLATATSEPAPVAVGSEARTSLYAVTVLDGELTDAVEEQYLEAEPGETLLVLTVVIENLTDHPIGVDSAADRVEARLIRARAPMLQVAQATSAFSTRAWRPDGSSGQVVLQPGVPSEIRIAWSVPDDAFPDGTARLDVFDAVEQGGQVILSSSTISWQRKQQTAQITVDLAAAV
ncbi:hypothetical protein [Microbacterium sp. NPDC087665]|uniref:hypothetical protein n=1 Tax=Microbacterium sp. NPDC087665 TaxID=3364194 RepID=UPI003812852A